MASKSVTTTPLRNKETMRTLAAAAFGGLIGILAVAVQGQPAQQQPLAPAAIERADAVLAETRKAMGGDKLDGGADDRGHRPDAPRARRQPRADRVRDRHRAARQVRPQGRGAGGRERADVDRIRRQRPHPVPAGAGGPGTARRTAGRVPPCPGRTRACRRRPLPSSSRRSARRGCTTTKQDFARLALGLFAVNARDVSADVRLRGAGGGAARHRRRARRARRRATSRSRLFVASDTHLPIMVSWQAPPTGVVVTTPGAAAAATGRPGRRFRRCARAAGGCERRGISDEYTKAGGRAAPEGAGHAGRIPALLRRLPRRRRREAAVPPAARDRRRTPPRKPRSIASASTRRSIPGSSPFRNS